MVFEFSNEFGSLYEYPGSAGRQTDKYNIRDAVHDFASVNLVFLQRSKRIIGSFLCCHNVLLPKSFYFPLVARQCYYRYGHDLFANVSEDDLPEGYHEPCILYPVHID